MMYFINKFLIILSLLVLCVSCSHQRKIEKLIEQGGDQDNASLYGIWTVTEREIYQDTEYYVEEDSEENSDPIAIETSDTLYTCLTISIRPDGICYVFEKIEQLPDDNYYNQNVNGHFEGTSPSDYKLSLNEDSSLILDQTDPNIYLMCSLFIKNGALVPITPAETECSLAYKVVQVKSLTDPTDMELSKLSRKKYEYSERMAVYKEKNDKKEIKYGYVFAVDDNVRIEPKYDMASPIRHGHAEVIYNGDKIIINKNGFQRFSGSFFIIDPENTSYQVDFSKKRVRIIDDSNRGPTDSTGFSYRFEAPLVLDDYYNIGYDDGGMIVYVPDIPGLFHHTPIEQQEEEGLSEEDQLKRKWYSMKPVFPIRVDHSNVLPIYYYLLARYNGSLHLCDPDSNLHLLLQNEPSGNPGGRATLLKKTWNGNYSIQSVANYGVDDKGLHLSNQKRWDIYKNDIMNDQPLEAFNNKGIQFGKFKLASIWNDEFLLDISKVNGFLDGRSPDQIGNTLISLGGESNPAIDAYMQSAREFERKRKEMEREPDPYKRQQMAKELEQMGKQYY